MTGRKPPTFKGPFEKSFASNPRSACWSEDNPDKPRDCAIKSDKKRRFDCECGHSFESMLGDISRGQWCPYCAGRNICGDINCGNCFKRSFASHEKASCWSEDNHPVKPIDVAISSNKKYRFDCDACSHSFESMLSNVSRGGQWCPYCAGRNICGDINCGDCFKRSFASHEKVSCWSEDNHPVKPIDVAISSGKKYRFDCDACSHSFEKTVAGVSGGGWCPYCAGKRLCGVASCGDCFKHSFASHEKASCWSEDNHPVKPIDVAISSGKKYRFDCDVCSHSFESQLSNINKGGTWCPYCASKSLCDKHDCVDCFKHSFASHEKASCWSEKNTDKPRDCAKSTHSMRIFKCDKCPHEFESQLFAISKGNWCPYCSGRTRCDRYDCNDCFKHSFASHERASCWSDKNLEDKPRDCAITMNEKRWFDCDECSHSFESMLSHISNGKWCPYCAGMKLCGVASCGDCFTRSFASLEKASCWSEDNTDKPRDCAKSTHSKRIFNCDKCSHSFESILSNITKGSWCPHCKTKTEFKLYEFLKIAYPKTVHQFKKDWCRSQSSKRYLPFDFCILALKIIIELDGAQHFKQVQNWQSPEENLKNDLYKEDCATENGYHVIRLLQEDVWNDVYDWKAELTNTIEDMKRRTDAEVECLCRTTEYDAYLAR